MINKREIKIQKEYNIDIFKKILENKRKEDYKKKTDPLNVETLTSI